MARASFSSAAFALLVRRLRHTNARYARIARQFRCRINRTCHAKQRAFRAGLRIDMAKLRASLEERPSRLPSLVLDRSAPGTSSCHPQWVGTPVEAHTYARHRVMDSGVDVGSGLGLIGLGTQSGATRVGDAYTRAKPFRNLPEVVVRRRRRDGRQRVVLCLPPLRLNHTYSYSTDGAVSSRSHVQSQESVPGAPRLLPKQLPEDEYGVEDMMLESSSSADESEVDSLLTPFDPLVPSGLCITVPLRNQKRRLQDIEEDEDSALPQRHKRFKLKMGRIPTSQ